MSSDIVQDGGTSSDIVQDGGKSSDIVQDADGGTSSHRVQDDGISYDNIVQKGGYTYIIRDGGMSSDIVQDGGKSSDIVQDGGMSSDIVQDGGMSSDIIQDGGMSPDIIQDGGPIDFNFDSDLLGTGSNGTLVFRGTYKLPLSGTIVPAAIKRIPKMPGKEFTRSILLEVKALQSLKHDNVVRYIDALERNDFILIALELCRGSLVNILDDQIKRDVYNRPFNSKQIYRWSFKKNLLMGVAKGLEYVHQTDRLHRDLKPQNILVQDDDSAYGLKAVISDFGLCREFGDGKSLLSVSRSIVGTNGWMAPEVLLERKKIGKSVDIFSFGCIIHYVMSLKRAKDLTHPFGEAHMRNGNILGEDRKIYIFENLHDRSFPSYRQSFFGDALLADMLIDTCISKDTNIRPRASELLSHPFFWSYAERVEFTVKCFNKYKDDFGTNDTISKLESLWDAVHPDDFRSNIPEIYDYYSVLRASTGRQPLKYSSSAIFNCFMRDVRNMQQHLNEAINLQPSLQNVLGSGDDGETFGLYFFEKVPKSFPVIFAGFHEDLMLKHRKKGAAVDKIVEQGFKTLKRLFVL